MPEDLPTRKWAKKSLKLTQNFEIQVTQIPWDSWNLATSNHDFDEKCFNGLHSLHWLSNIFNFYKTELLPSQGTLFSGNVFVWIFIPIFASFHFSSLENWTFFRHWLFRVELCLLKSSTVLHEKQAKNTVLNQLQMSKKRSKCKRSSSKIRGFEKKTLPPVLSTKSARIFAPSDFSKKA